MKILSLASKGLEFRQIEVEVTLVNGLPNFQIMGLPDTAIKESAVRIKTAIKTQGFEWPRTQQVLVNLRPNYLRKTSQGLELAIAVAILLKTGQIQLPEEKEMIFYGSLGLDGDVFAPEDLEWFQPLSQTVIVTGDCASDLSFDVFRAQTLQDLNSLQLIKGQDWTNFLKAPILPEIYFPPVSAKLLAVLAAGEHPALLAGPAGSGKTTFVESLFYLLPAPEKLKFLRSKNMAKVKGFDLKWRPFVAPHHSTPPLAMIGGGSPIFPGEISRAHGGLLVMDEFLEFSSKVQEALREPIERGEIRVSRKGQVEILPAEFQLVASTNLCPCGDLVPNRSNNCSYSLMKCRSTTERLSGPMLDRFEVLAFSHQWQGEKSESLQSIKLRVDSAVEFRKQRGQSLPNSKLAIGDLKAQLDSFTEEKLLPDMGSQRRLRSLLRVARTLADLDGEKKLHHRYISPAFELCFRPFESLKRLFS